ncbi:MAG: hypothetical protein HYZ45_05740, partial [Burkholderiales bacterium]|nr:hypothetical protein [Burkholderiales bacterium]
RRAKEDDDQRGTEGPGRFPNEAVFGGVSAFGHAAFPRLRWPQDAVDMRRYQLTAGDGEVIDADVYVQIHAMAIFHAPTSSNYFRPTVLIAVAAFNGKTKQAYGVKYFRHVYEKLGHGFLNYDDLEENVMDMVPDLKESIVTLVPQIVQSLTEVGKQ